MDASSHPPHDRAIAALATRQHGVVALFQLKELGLAGSTVRARVTFGRLHRIHRGVYAVGHRNLTRHGRWMAAVLAHGSEAALSHDHCLALWGLRGLPAGPIDVTVPARGRRSSPRIRVHNVRALQARDRTRIDGIPATTVHRALLDVAETATRQELRLAIEAADRRELLDTREVDALIERSPGRRGAPALRGAVAALIGPAPWTRSQLEREFLALVREGGLPEPQMNVIIAGVPVDAIWPAQRLVVELDGYDFHRGRARFESDRRRDTTLVLGGFRVIRLTQRRLMKERARVIEELWTLLRAAA